MAHRPMAMEELWRTRARAFRKESAPYVHYMLQSGLLTVLALLFILSSIGYFTFIRHIPPQFPITAAGVIALTPVLCWSPLRTWLFPADTVFLMPREGEMDGYMRHSFQRTALRTALLAAIVLLLYVPIYRQGAGHHPEWILALAAVLLKGVNVWGSWRERQIVWPNLRRVVRSIRWLVTALALAVWLTCVLWQAVGFTLLSGLLMVLVYRLPRRQRFPWQRLILEEQATRRRYYVWFGMFVDVPVSSFTVRPRPYLSWLLRLISYNNKSTYVLLYAAALLRMEIGGIVIRQLLLGCLIVYWLADALLLLGWGAALVYGLLLGVIALQLGSLRHIHRHTVWRHVYPLPEKQRIHQLITVDVSGFAFCSLLLLLPLSIPLIRQGVYAPAAAAFVLGALYLLLRPARLRVKARKEAEDE